jgi:ABC-type multidrug transport system ATPase subunit
VPAAGDRRPAGSPVQRRSARRARLDAFDASTARSTSRARISAALERVGLGAAAAKKFRRYSLGMKQRLGLAATLLRPRDLLILDEPTNGLDPQGTREVRALIRELAADGTTVLVSSHLLGEIEQVATHVGIMSDGRLLKQGPLDAVLAETSTQVRVQTTRVPDASAVLTGLGLEITTSPRPASLSGSTGCRRRASTRAWSMPASPCAASPSSVPRSRICSST